MPVRYARDVPAERLERVKRRLHAEGVLGDAAGEFRVVVGDDEDVRVDPPFDREPGMAAKRLARLALHRGSVGQGANGDPVAARGVIREG